MSKKEQKAPQESDDRVILIRCTAAEHEMVKRIAKAEDRTMTSTLRRMFRIGFEAYQPQTIDAMPKPPVVHAYGAQRHAAGGQA